MYGIHYVRASSLGKIIQFENNGLVRELSLFVRGIFEVTMNQSLGTHGNSLPSGPGTESNVFYDLLCKRGLRELI